MIDQAPDTWHEPAPGRAYVDPYGDDRLPMFIPLSEADARATRSFWRGFGMAVILCIIAGILQPVIWWML